MDLQEFRLETSVVQLPFKVAQSWIAKKISIKSTIIGPVNPDQVKLKVHKSKMHAS